MAKKKTLVHLRHDDDDLAACGAETHEDLDLGSDSKTHVVCLPCVRALLDEREDILDDYREVVGRFNEMAERLNGIRALSDPQVKVDFFERKAVGA